MSNGDSDCALANQICVDDSGVASSSGEGANDVCACKPLTADDGTGTCVIALGKQQQ
jgi:hypothetical protein